MRLAAQFLGLLLLVQIANLSADQSAIAPNKDLTPDQVIKIVVDALRHNSPDNGDDGIATVYRFASPNNKQMTGPLERFTAMIKRGFYQMLNHIDSHAGEMELTDDTALQAVWLTAKDGKIHGYAFQVGKQQSGEYAGMWMTESVWPLGIREPVGDSI